jgi:hypothetical protein
MYPEPLPIRRRQLRSSRKFRWGAATVEMAFVAPVIILLVFGSIEFARMMMVRQAMTNAAREGCRHACLVTTSNDSEVKQFIVDTLQGVIDLQHDPNAVVTTVEPSFTAPPTSGTRITTSLEVNCAEVSWLPPMFYAGAKMRVVSSMHRE